MQQFTAEDFRKRAYRELRRKLKSLDRHRLNPNEQGYAYELYIGKSKDFDDFIHFIFQVWRYEEKFSNNEDIWFLKNEKFLTTKMLLEFDGEYYEYLITAMKGILVDSEIRTNRFDLVSIFENLIEKAEFIRGFELIDSGSEEAHLSRRGKYSFSDNAYVIKTHKHYLYLESWSSD